jgi:hypothetical protein
MQQTDRHFANRCLPLLVANEAGWAVLSDRTVCATWTGGVALSDLSVECPGTDGPYPASSHFGSGILTWTIPYLFRTPPGWNLHVRGPVNWPKDGVQALEGIVETDWAVATFTMNYKLTRPGLRVEFAPGEPICMVVPQRRGELERFLAEVRDIANDPALGAAYGEWKESRADFNAQLKVAGSPEAREGWQRHYMRGTAPDGRVATEHQVRVRVATPNVQDA